MCFYTLFHAGVSALEISSCGITFTGNGGLDGFHEFLLLDMPTLVWAIAQLSFVDEGERLKFLMACELLENKVYSNSNWGSSDYPYRCSSHLKTPRRG